MGLAIFISSRSMKISKVLPRNIVAVFATVLFISYTKLLRTAFSVFSAVRFTRYLHCCLALWRQSRLLWQTPCTSDNLLNVYCNSVDHSKIQIQNKWIVCENNRHVRPIHMCDIVSLPGNGVTSFYLVIFSWDSLGHHTCTSESRWFLKQH